MPRWITVATEARELTVATEARGLIDATTARGPGSIVLLAPASRGRRIQAGWPEIHCVRGHDSLVKRVPIIIGPVGWVTDDVYVVHQGLSVMRT